MADLLNVEFTAANAVRDKKPYTVYEMRISSSITPSWIILKRYRDFFALNEQLSQRLASDEELTKINKDILAALPKKKRFNSMKADVVSARQSKLEEYVRTLIKNPSFRRTDLLMDFLSVPEAVRLMILQQTPNHRHSRVDPYDMNRKPKNKALSEEDYEVTKLIEKLHKQKDRVKALQRFEEWYFMERAEGNHGIPIQLKIIRKLLKGDDHCRGLIQSCKLSHSKTAWRGSLRLLCKLMDVERNKYARMFIQVFLYKIDHSLYREMDLHRHIKDCTQEDGLMIVQLIHEGLPTLDPTVYVCDAEAWVQYLKWSMFVNDSFTVGIDLEPEQLEKEQDLFNIHKFKVDDKEEKKSSLSAKNNNDHLFSFNYTKMANEIIAKFHAFGLEPDEDYRNIQKINEKYGNFSMRVRCKKETLTDHWKVKISFLVNHAPNEIYEFLKRSYIETGNEQKQSPLGMYNNGWNKKLIDKKVVEELDEDNFIMHEVYKSFNSPYKFRDFVLLRTFQEVDCGNECKHYFILCSSLSNYEKVPETTDKLRCIIYPSGFEIRPYNNISKRSFIEHRLHFTSESVNIVTADLLGECDELFQSMTRISSLITNEKQKKKVQQLAKSTRKTVEDKSN